MNDTSFAPQSDPFAPSRPSFYRTAVINAAASAPSSVGSFIDDAKSSLFRCAIGAAIGAFAFKSHRLAGAAGGAAAAYFVGKVL